MEIEDLFKLLVPFVWFAIATAVRAARKAGNKQRPVSRDNPAESATEYQPEAYADDGATEEPSDPRERVQAQLTDVFRQLGLDVDFSTPAPNQAPPPTSTAQPSEIQSQEGWRPDESTPAEVATDAPFYEEATDATFHEDATDAVFHENAVDTPFYEDATDAPFHEAAVDEEFDELAARGASSELERLLNAQRETLERAARIRRAETPHLDAGDVRSMAVVRDAIVLNALLHRPQWGRRTLRRSR